MLGPDAWFTMVVLAIMFVALVKDYLGADIVLFGALVTLWTVGIVDTRQALAGFSNPQVHAVAFLFIVSAAMQETGALAWVSRTMLRPATSSRRMLARLLVPTAGMSAFLNNTPIVAMFAPAVRDWAIRNGKAPSKYLIPLSYAAIIGGTCTLIGTSTNLVVSGLLEENGYGSFSMFEISPVGVPAAILGILFLATIGQRLLPSRQAPEQIQSSQDREYSVRLRVGPECPLIGKTVEGAGLRQLSGLFLAEIERGDQRIVPVKPTNRLRANDHLILFGLADTVVELRKIRGIELVSDDDVDRVDEASDNGSAATPERSEGSKSEGTDGEGTDREGTDREGTEEAPTPADARAGQAVEAPSPNSAKKDAARATYDDRRLFEVVVSANSPLVGTTLRDAGFRRRYDAAVVAIHRNGARLKMKLGDVDLRAGDTLMVEAAPGFRRAWGNSQDFYLVADVNHADRPRYGLANLALLILVLMITMMAFDFAPTVLAAALAVVALLVTRCVRPVTARKSLDLTVLVVIACSFGLSNAVVNSGLAAAVAGFVLDVFGDYRPWVILAVVYILTSVFTEILSNNAAAALITPIAISTAVQIAAIKGSDPDPRPYAIAVAIAASKSFITPIGYQTNLMVYGPGGYKFTDFARIGVPMAILCFAISMIIIPIFWPL